MIDLAEVRSGACARSATRGPRALRLVAAILLLATWSAGQAPVVPATAVADDAPHAALAAAVADDARDAAPAAAAADDAFHEEWQRVLLDGHPAGYVHERRSAVDGGLLRLVIETRLRVARMGQEVSLAFDQSSLEHADGQVVALGMRAAMPGETLTTATVVDGQLAVVVASSGQERRFSETWSGDIRGEAWSRRRLAEWLPGATVGESLSTVTYDLSIGSRVASVYTLREVGPASRSVELETDVMPSLRQRLVIGSDGRVLRHSTLMLGMDFVIEACERSEALAAHAEAGGGQLPAEAFEQTLLRPDIPLPRPRSLDRLVVRLHARDPSRPLPDFSSPRQRVLSRDDQGLVLEIRRVRPGDQPASDERPPAACLEPNAFIESDDAEVRALARRLGGGLDDDWQRALALERGVREYIDEKSLGVAFATAAETCRSRTGDCSEHAVLLAALCRAEGLPARVAMGLVYLGGIFGGHAWTEVWIDGAWVALDATQGLGPVDATHLRFAASDLSGLGFGVAMYGAVLELANLEVSVVELERAGVTRGRDELAAWALEVDGVQLTSSAHDVSLRCPEGFEWDPEPPAWSEGLVARARHADGRQLQLSASAVGTTFDADELAAGFSADEPRLILRLHDRPAVLGWRGAWCLSVLDGDTVLSLRLVGERDESLALELLMEVTRCLTLDDSAAQQSPEPGAH